MKKGSIHIYRLFEFIILIGLLGFMLWWRMQVGEMRFFDVDEFTHMHWAANMAHGQKPYIDFFTFFTPGFYWLLTPLFWFYPRSPMIFPAARMGMFVVFLGIIALTGALFAMLRSRRWALVPVLILVFLPMPYDKFLEIRPDNVATLLGLAGVVLQIYAMLHNFQPINKKGFSLALPSSHVWLMAGLCYASSLIVLVKMLPFVVMGGLVALLYWFRWDKGLKWDKEAWGEIRYCLVGLGIPVFIFLVWLLSLGHFSVVWYSLTRLAFEANEMGRVFIMEPHLFFFPNASFYGGWGITEPLVLNHTIWFIGLLVGCYRFLTPVIAGDGKREKVLSEVLISGIFILSVVGYVTFFPLKHSQYLIPIAIFIAWYCADFLITVLAWVEKNLGKLAVVILLILLAILLGRDTIRVNTNKLLMSNMLQLEQTKSLLAMIPKDGSVLDLDGRLIFWKDPYYICCLPFGSFTRFLSRPPASLSNVLEEKKVQYIYQGDSGRLWELTDDLPYINAHYERVPGWGDALWKRKE